MIFEITESFFGKKSQKNSHNATVLTMHIKKEKGRKCGVQQALADAALQKDNCKDAYGKRVQMTVQPNGQTYETHTS